MDKSSDSVPAAAGARAGRREWIGLAVIALPCLLYSMDLTVLNLAVPQLSADLKPSAAQLLWIVDIYGFMVAGALVTMGTLGDRIGRRRLLMIGAAAFGATSILAAFSTSAEMLIAARALLGLAAATLASSTLSLIRNMFHDPGERTFAIGVWIASFSAGAAIGPVVGGILISAFWWGSVFLIAVPVMIVLLVVAPFLLPEYRDPQAGRFDLASAGLSLLAVLAAIFGIKQWAATGFDAISLASLGAGIVLGIMFVARQNGRTDPLIDLTLFHSAAFSISLAVNLASFFVAFGSFLLIAQFLQLVLGLSPLEAGLWSLPSALAFIAGSTTTPGLSTRFGPVRMMSCGLLVAAMGFGMLALAVAPASLALLVGGATLMSLGLAPVFTLTTDLIIGSAPPERAGSAAGIAETSSELGGALGIAILGSVVAAVYRKSMQDGLGAIPEAMDTLGGAIAHASAIGGPEGEATRQAALEAYGSGFGIAMLACIALALVTGWMVAAILPRGRPCEEPVA